MKNTKKDNNLKHTLLIIFLTLIIGLAQYFLFPNENQVASTTENETIQTSSIVASSPEKQTSTTVETNSNIRINDIPQYSGQIVIDINNNVPYFEEKDLTTADFEDYSPLDELNRGGQAFANIGKYTMPKERN